jgi:PAS domain S-box-containing protein
VNLRLLEEAVVLIDGRLAADAKHQEGSVADQVSIRDFSVTEKEWRSAISDLEQVQAELAESRGRLDAIIQSAMDAILTMDDQQKIVLFNAAAERMFGCTASEAIGHSIERFIPKRFRPAHAEHVRKFAKTGVSSRAMGSQQALWAVRTNGQEFQIEASISQVESAGKRLFTVILRDVSERVRAEESLRDFKYALDQHAIVATTDVRGTITYVNDKFCAISQYPQEELIGKNHRILNSGYHPREFFQEMYHQIANGQVWHGEIRNRAKDGSFYWVDTTIVPFLTDDGRPHQYIAIRADITERKRAAEALKESLLTSQAALKELADQKFALDQAAIVATTDVQGTITYVNDKFCAISQYRREELIGKNHRILNSGYHPREFFQEMYRQIANGQVWHGEIRNRAKDGSIYWVDTTIVPLLDAARKPMQYLAIRAVITERKLAEERLAQKVAELARSNAELEQFAYVASHDLQEPLRMVANYTQLLAERHRGKLDAQSEKYIRYAVDGATRMQAMIQDLLAFSRAGRGDKEEQSVNTDAALNEALCNLRPVIAESGAVVDFASLPKVRGNHTQIVQLFQNLVGNAIKFRGENTPLVGVGVERKNGECIFFVKDNGIGIAKEHASVIFSIFQRLHTRSEYPGNGIGLAICKKIVERYGGRIWVESNEGQGATFRFSLPTATDGSQETGLRAGAGG